MNKGDLIVIHFHGSTDADGQGFRHPFSSCLSLSQALSGKIISDVITGGPEK